MRHATLLCSLLACVSGAVAAAGSAIVPADVRVEPVVSGFTRPVALRHAGDARLFVVEQGGRIRIVSAGTVLPTPLVDLVANPPPGGFSTGGERGLLGLAFHPDHAGNGYLYLNYTDGDGHTVIARYTRALGNPDAVDPATAAVLMRIKQDFSNHNGGDLLFGADGMLYIGMGDGGSGNDPCDRAQTLPFASLLGSGACSAAGYGGDPRSRALLGKLLRIDVDGSGGGHGERCGADTGLAGAVADYGIPADNPYAAADGICDEVFASGLRNPWRFSEDRATGDLLIADVGQGAREELNLLPADSSGGENFGWRCREGDIATPNVSCPGPQPTFTDPVLVYPRSVGASITGGYRYRGPIGGLVGAYVYGDYVFSRLFAARPHSGQWHSTQLAIAGVQPSGFGEDAAGHVYVLDYASGAAGAGRLLRLVSDTLFVDGFEPDD